MPPLPKFLITHRFFFPLPQLLTLSNQSNQSWILYFSWALTHGKQVAQVAHDLRVLFLFTQSWVKSAFFRKTQHCWLWLSLQSTMVWSITHKHWKLLQFTSFIAKPKKYISVIAEPANDQKSTPARFSFLVPQTSPTSHSLLQQTPEELLLLPSPTQPFHCLLSCWKLGQEDFLMHWWVPCTINYYIVL